MKCKCKGLKLASIIEECTDRRMNTEFLIKDIKEKLKNYKRMIS
jgi:hypothetical protein